MDWSIDGSEHGFGESVEVSPKSEFHCRSVVNLRAIVESEIRVVPLLSATSDHWNRNSPVLFWKENMSVGDGRYIFQTRYVHGEEILPLKYMGNIPRHIFRQFLAIPFKATRKLAEKLSGREKSTEKVLRRFFDFICENMRYDREAKWKCDETIVDEYHANGYFCGKCDTATTLFMNLCDAKRIPTKRVYGKPKDPAGHACIDVFVPVRGGYRILPVDPTWKSFGQFKNHYFDERTPRMPFYRRRSDYTMRIKCVD